MGKKYRRRKGRFGIFDRSRKADIAPEPAENSSADAPLWKSAPDKYAKKKSGWQKALIKTGSFLLSFFLVAGVIGIICVGVAAAVIYSYSDPELLEILSEQDLNMSSTIYALDGNGNYVEYETLYSREHRSWTNSEDIPQCVKNAAIAIEDKRFYTHMGVDFITSAKAVIEYTVTKVVGGSTASVGGGSTITQQLVKNITHDDEVTPQRKIEEMFRAFYIERNYSKEQILEFYLNTIYFNNNCYGIGTASQFYFGKDVSELNPLEAATIIAITKSPAYYDPYTNPENNEKRRNQILYEMKEQGYLSYEEYDNYINASPDLKDKTMDSSSSDSNTWSYATDMVFEAVIQDLMDEFGYTKAEALNKMYTAGLKIYTTFDIDIQNIMEEFFSNEENYNDEKYLDEETGEYVYPEVAMEILDPATGDVLGVIGGRGEKEGKLGLNRVTQSPKQPGSAIKPISVYGYALENDIITAGTPIDDFPVQLYGSNPWPLNFDRTYTGIVDVYKALSYSLNAPSARVLEMVGIDTAYDFAKTMLGLESLVEEDRQIAPLSVGSLTYGVTVQELTGAYTAYANGGVYTEPRCYSRVVNYKGETILDNPVNKRVVFSEQTTFIMTDILQEVIRISSNGRAAKVEGVETAGKTGTTSNFYDRWFIGYTPYYLGGIWWGYDKNHETDSVVSYQTRLWGKVMTLIHQKKGYTSGEFSQPDGIVKSSYCSVSGMLPNEYCPSAQNGNPVKTGYFKEGTQPTQQCTAHHALYVCDTSGKIAHENCPSAHLEVFVEPVGGLRSFPITVKVKDAEYICPRLPQTLVLYNDSVLPVYMNMLDSGEYPGIPYYSKQAYANTLCTAHTPSATPHVYTGSSNTPVPDIPEEDTDDGEVDIPPPVVDDPNTGVKPDDGTDTPDI